MKPPYEIARVNGLVLIRHRITTRLLQRTPQNSGVMCSERRKGAKTMLDEHGMPVPVYAHGPFRVIPNDDTSHDEAFLVLDGENNVICPIWQKDIGEFYAHAANWIIPCREVVRRLAETMNAASSGDFEGQAYRVAADAAKLWADMQQDAKGGDCAEVQ